MSGTTLTLATARQERLSEGHRMYLSAAIARCRGRAQDALRLARIVARNGNHALAAGLFDESATYLAMANSLADQLSTSEGEQ